MTTAAMDRRISERRAKRENLTEGEERRHNERRALTRRSCPRIQTELWAKELRGDDCCYFRRVANLSEGGLFFDVAVPINAGAAVTLSLKLPGEANCVQARGRVARVDGDKTLGMGIAFTSFEDDGGQRVGEYVRTISASDISRD